MALGCATALPWLAAPSAVASPVGVVRLDGAGNVTMAGGDLATPDVASMLPGPSGAGVVSVHESVSPLDIGPIFAEISFYSSPSTLVAVNESDIGSMVFGGQSGDTGTPDGGSLGGAGTVSPSNALSATGSLSGGTDSNTGTLEGNTNSNQGSGTIVGTIPGTSVITIDGTVGSPSPVPIPAAAVLFATGAAAVAGLLRRRPVG